MMAVANVKQAVPLLGVTNMEASLRFYVDGLGFEMKRWWIPDRDQEYPADGKIRWCWLELGEAAMMLQEFMPQGRPKATLGAGASVCFQCADALALYRQFKSRGVEMRKRPSVGNRLWVVPVADPDGYRMEFESPTDAPEGSELAEWGFSSPASSLLCGRQVSRHGRQQRPVDALAHALSWLSSPGCGPGQGATWPTSTR